MASAFAAIASAGPEDHCAAMMYASAQDDSCPCCPDGESGVADCLSACTASLGAIVEFSFVYPCSGPARVTQAAIFQRIQAAEPPLKPPPIY
jgi:hypothetical protein